MPVSHPQMDPETTAVIEALASELQATESSLAQWRAHAGSLHSQLRALRCAPNDSLGTPRVLAGRPISPNGTQMAARPREHSTSSVHSAVSLISQQSAPPRLSRAGPASPQERILPQFFTREFWDPKTAMTAQRRRSAIITLQRHVRGHFQRRRYKSLRAFFAIVNGAIELRSGGTSIPAYTLTVVRGGRCWQVSHRYSDWVELNRQVVEALPKGIPHPALPGRHLFRSARIVTYRQFALNRCAQPPASSGATWKDS